MPLTDKQYDDFCSELSRELRVFRKDMMDNEKDIVYYSANEIVIKNEIVDFLYDYGKEYPRNGFPKKNILERVYKSFIDSCCQLTNDEMIDFFDKYTKRHIKQEEM